MGRAQNPEANGVAVEIDRRTDLMQRTLLRRWLDALFESRVRKAESVVREQLGYFSDDVLRRAGYRRRKRD
jgi:hypothetical protein